ncbi:TetR/AcrR family transcriptional regulator [Paenibacillus sp. SYP-B4298]|uniref:TetR/AcrR family transcriptional regulator n=1 Tax=Paenibacillus sp. SYP-B4298 TaxID=2996034 RepID=UPI0022DD6405|nr:TetR/AcrR family transcriptional regulator [Paenibacillus sp. SYP-B4298]
MARNKFPEQTLEHILDVSARLFTEKGYEKTSIQDIIAALGMSKGAIYHHFKSKEDLLAAVMQRQFDASAALLEQLVRELQAPTARERMVLLLEGLLADDKTHALDAVLGAQIHQPSFVVSGMKQGVMQDARIIAGLIEEGNRDGSLHCPFPEACAEVFMLLMNIWANPVLFQRQEHDTERRLVFLQELMKGMGADVMSDALIARMLERHRAMGGYAT